MSELFDTLKTITEVYNAGIRAEAKQAAEQERRKREREMEVCLKWFNKAYWEVNREVG